MNSAFINFLFLNIYKNRAFHLSTFFMFFLLVFIFSSALFVKSSILTQTKEALKTHPEFVVQALRGGDKEPIDESYLYEFEEIFGVNGVSGRVYGRYYDPFGKKSFMIVGVDPFDEIVTKQIEDILQTQDLQKFLTNGAVISSGVKEYLKGLHFQKSYTFLTHQKGSLKVDILGTLSKHSAITANDVILLSKQNARKILGLDEGVFSDIVLKVDNELEYETIRNELLAKYRNIDVILKEDLLRAYLNSYDFKSGLFLTLAILCLVIFLMILYFKYSFTQNSTKKEIGILRALGWSIKDLITLKMLESLFVSSFTFMAGFIFAYIYIYVFDAYLIKDIFLGYQNIAVVFDFTPQFEISLFLKLYLFLMTAFSFAVLVPTWRLSVNSAKEAMK